MWKLRTCRAICDTNIKPKSATKKLKSTNSWSKDREGTWESQGESQLKNILILLTCRRIGKCRNAFPCHTSILLPSNSQDSFGKIRIPHNCLTPLKPHKSQTPLVHHFTPSSFTISRPGATDPRAKHQALIPWMPILLSSKSMFVRVLLTFNASARACGQKDGKQCENWELAGRSASLT